MSGLTSIQQGLIEAVAKNNLPKARECALGALAEDTTQKNTGFCRKYKNIIQSNSTNFVELPFQVKSLLRAEDVSESFHEERYYLSAREAEVFDHISRMQNVTEKLAAMDVKYLNTTLLFGASGTGKTMFGRYVAYKMNLPFLYLNFSGLIDSYLGKTSQNLASAFDFAKSTPCVFMLDELDCISAKRGGKEGGSAEKEMDRITISLMQEFDSLTNNHIIIGATNRLDIIDTALLRRFSRHHEVLPLSTEEKISMINAFLTDTIHEYDKSKVEAFCGGDFAKDATQAQLINATIESIALSLQNDTPFAFIK